MPHEYYMPTRLVSGRGCLVERGALLRELGTKALVVTGARSARASGALDDALRALRANGQAHALFDRVASNPSVESVLEGAAFARAEGCDFVVAIGGGSPMDAGKAMALLAARQGELGAEGLFAASYSACLPVAAVPTTAGTGSEVTPYAVLTDNAAEAKTNLANPLLFPRLAFLDGAYMRELGREVTVNTAVDALSHAVEGMLTVRANPVTDALAIHSLSMIARCLGGLCADTLTHDERDTLLMASALAGMAIANSGTTAVHALGYPFTYYKGVDHGRANGIILAAFVAFVDANHPGAAKRILAALELESIDAFGALLEELLVKPEQISESEARHFVRKASAARNIGNSLVAPTENDLYAVLQASPLVNIQK